MKTILLFLSIFSCLAANVFSARPYVVVLGIAQDAGVPQIGCTSEFCKKAWKDKKLQKRVSSIALIDPDSKKRWIFDATPDLPLQFQSLKQTTRDFSNILDGVFLTHGHIGHYTGLMYLGRESLNASSVPVYVMPRMESFLKNNGPWSQLIELKNIELRPIVENRPTALSVGINVTPFLVPHRDEFTETVGYRIQTNRQVPDLFAGYR